MFNWFRRNRSEALKIASTEELSNSKLPKVITADDLIAKGHKLEDQGELESALKLYFQAAENDPLHVGPSVNIGNVYFALGEYNLARAAYDKALLLQPQHAGAHFNLGNVLLKLQQPTLALDAYCRATLLKPNFVDAWIAYGNLLGDLGRHDESAEAYLHALTLTPDHVECLRNLGLCQRQLGRLHDAATNFKRAVDHDPGHLSVRMDLTNVLREMGKIKEAVEQAQQCVMQVPHDPGVRSLMLFTQSHNPKLTPQAWFDLHKQFGQLVDSTEKLSLPLPVPSTTEMLRIGFVTADLRNHAVASFFEPVFYALCEQAQVQVVVYDTGGEEDHVTKRMKRASVTWNASISWNDDQFASAVQNDGIHVLVDLAGHTPGHRLRVFGMRVAPLQWSWIGYPGTTGMSTMDHALGDPHYLPPGRFDHLFTEKIFRLPANAPFTPSSDAPSVNDLPALSRGYFTFASFNRLDKISQEVVSWWCAVLREIPDSKFLLGGMPKDQDLSEILGWFQSEGIDGDRLAICRRSTMREYLQQHQDVDLCLDTFPYGGGTTTCHAMWMGVPTVTRAGQIPAGHTSAAIMGQLALSEMCVAENLEEYVSHAKAWASQLGELQAIRKTLRQRFAQSALGQPGLISEALVLGARTALARRAANQPVESFGVEKSRDGVLTVRRHDSVT